MRTEGSCSSCLALASYYIQEGSNITYISNLFNQQSLEIQKYNYPNLKNIDVIQSHTRINVPFTCECLNGVFLGHTFSYTTIHGDTYNSIANVIYSNLTTEEWMTRVNKYKPTDIPDSGKVNVTVNCSCGDKHVSKKFGLFLTYPLRKGENLSGIAVENGVPVEVLQRYNPGSDFSAGHGLVFVPAKG
ncbi:lysM domain receptor kinase [Trifolium repens]|jgi:chitin elicitor receptor kinase 1|nr:lysM domain receptor kinase [Trifolium repens]